MNKLKAALAGLAAAAALWAVFVAADAQAQGGAPDISVAGFKAAIPSSDEILMVADISVADTNTSIVYRAAGDRAALGSISSDSDMDITDGVTVTLIRIRSAGVRLDGAGTEGYLGVTGSNIASFLPQPAQSDSLWLMRASTDEQGDPTTILRQFEYRRSTLSSNPGMLNILAPGMADFEGMSAGDKLVVAITRSITVPTPSSIAMSGKIIIKANDRARSGMVPITMPSTLGVQYPSTNVIICKEGTRCYEDITPGGEYDSIVPYQIGARRQDYEMHAESTSQVCSELVTVAVPFTTSCLFEQSYGTVPDNLIGSLVSSIIGNNVLTTFYFIQPFPFDEISINYSSWNVSENVERIFRNATHTEHGIKWSYSSGNGVWTDFNDSHNFVETLDGFQNTPNKNAYIRFDPPNDWEKSALRFQRGEFTANSLNSRESIDDMGYIVRGSFYFTQHINFGIPHININTVRYGSLAWWVYVPHLAAGETVNYDVYIRRSPFPLPSGASVDDMGMVIVPSLIQTKGMPDPFSRHWTVVTGELGRDRGKRSNGVDNATPFPTPFPTPAFASGVNLPGGSSQQASARESYYWANRLISLYDTGQPWDDDRAFRGFTAALPSRYGDDVSLPVLHAGLAARSSDDGSSVRLVWLYGEDGNYYNAPGITPPKVLYGSPKMGMVIDWDTVQDGKGNAAEPELPVEARSYALMYEYDASTLLTPTPNVSAYAKVYSIPEGHEPTKENLAQHAELIKSYEKINYLPTRVPVEAPAENPAPTIYGLNFPRVNAPDGIGNNDLGVSPFLYIRKIVVDGGDGDDVVITAANINDYGAMWSYPRSEGKGNYTITLAGWERYIPQIDASAAESVINPVGPIEGTSAYSGTGIPQSLPGATFINSQAATSGVPARFIWVMLTMPVAMLAIIVTQKVFDNILYSSIAGGVVLVMLCAPAVGIASVWVVIFYAVLCACVAVIGRRLSAGI